MPEKLPEHLLVDEKHSGLEGHKCYLSTTVAGGCLLGASVTPSASTEALEAAYGEFADEARALNRLEFNGTSAQKKLSEYFPMLFVKNVTAYSAGMG